MSAATFGDLMAALGAFRKDCLRGEPSNRAIARALGVSPQTVTNWFAGRHFGRETVDTLPARLP